ncbi:EthD family reductase [Georgenia sp. EYE_87]|uniref:EthD family reductase n=1 Tax=Georgenia sp. EYE_87 TaxID=2853448 RepID=UPI0020068CCA|nr:EthD family reductase [Georgenia sp. EYE_87]MCK6211619.1 EthD family reductase [Georgenia sp. EYE_87]
MLRKRVALLQRRSDLSFAEFDEHWAVPHAAIIADLPGLDEYVQNSVRSFWTNGEPERTVDGIVEVWFDDGVVASPQAHTSAAQQDDEVRFIRTLTAFTVTNRQSYDAEAKVWVLSPEPFDLASLAGSVAVEPMVAQPDADAVLMERPRLRREAAAPACIAVFPTGEDGAEDLFEAVVDGFAVGPAPSGVRVVRTASRRVR